MKKMRFLAALAIFSLVLQYGATAAYGDKICPLFEIDTTNNPDYSSYYGDICPGHGADLLDAAPGLFEFCGNCDQVTNCGADCIDYIQMVCQGKGEKLRHGVNAKGVKLSKKNKPNKLRKLNSTAKCKVTDLSTPNLFVTFTPTGKAPITAQLYDTLAVPTDSMTYKPRLFGTGHEIDGLPPSTTAIAVPGVITTVTSSVYHFIYKGVEYQVITMPK